MMAKVQTLLTNKTRAVILVNNEVQAHLNPRRYLYRCHAALVTALSKAVMTNTRHTKFRCIM